MPAPFSLRMFRLQSSEFLLRTLGGSAVQKRRTLSHWSNPPGGGGSLQNVYLVYSVYSVSFAGWTD
jgi:hypothetical protein